MTKNSLNVMFYQILAFLLDVASGLIGGACLLRLYMQQQRVPFANPVGKVVFALTDWLVLPLRRVVPSVGRWDLASLVGAFLLELAQFGILWLIAGSLASLADCHFWRFSACCDWRFQVCQACSSSTRFSPGDKPVRPC